MLQRRLKYTFFFMLIFRIGGGFKVRAQPNTLYLTVVEMAKAYSLDLYKYLNFLFEQRPSKDMSDEEFEKLAPWNESVKELCSVK